MYIAGHTNSGPVDFTKRSEGISVGQRKDSAVHSFTLVSRISYLSKWFWKKKPKKKTKDNNGEEHLPVRTMNQHWAQLCLSEDEWGCSLYAAWLRRMKTPGGLSVGIQDGKGASSSNPHVNTGAKPGWDTTGANQSHRDAEARSDGNHSKQVDNDSNDSS